MESACKHEAIDPTSRLVASLPGLRMEWLLGRSPLAGDDERGSDGRTPIEKYGCCTKNGGFRCHALI